MDRSEEPGPAPEDRAGPAPAPADRPPDRTGTLRPPARAVSARLIGACAGVVVLVALAVYGALREIWPLFFVCCVLTAVTAAYAIVEGERLRRDDDPAGAD
ncbi:hypothetical protein [Sphaerisporangium corydalis]|uniref:Uncharacterized protein n=1 Tax=Sphaerisporangium corydalis TaxID=1441875 RepID=A0ABV9EHD3_9ACTN|nr:hypothetical protein [Sphaerisporangium corydalis]